MRAFERGREIARQFGLDADDDLDPLLRSLGLEVIPWRFTERLREVIFEGAIGIDESLPPDWRRWLTAHAIGHHVLHTGTSLYLESWQWVSQLKSERQAEEFAAGLLVPPGAVADGSGESAIARRCNIPREKAHWALSTFLA